MESDIHVYLFISGSENMPCGRVDNRRDIAARLHGVRKITSLSGSYDNHVGGLVTSAWQCYIIIIRNALVECVELSYK